MNVEPIIDKFESFGWRTIPVKNGHDYNEILSAIEKALIPARKPTVIVCNTIKGKGVAFAERNPSYHGVALSKEEMQIAIPALEKELQNI
jgi:transketolase